MQFLTSLIGGSGNLYLNAAMALGVVIILILLGLWALKLVFRASSTIGRGARRRLAVVDSLPVDNKRQLVIVRRDNVEHLILTGGPQDLLVESGFALEAAPVALRPVPPVPPVRGPMRTAQSAAPAGASPQRAPTPQRAQGPESPQASNDHNAVHDSLDRLREFNRPNGPRRPSGLRHTGLMRPVSRMEPPLAPANADKSARPNPDSATTGRVTPFGAPQNGNGQAFGRDTSGEQRDEGF